MISHAFALSVGFIIGWLVCALVTVGNDRK